MVPWSAIAMAMTLKHPVLAVAIVAFASPVLHATSSANQEQEYQQERTIALRDPKVRAAYEEADRKLEAKIIQIDPALADYVHHRGNAPVQVAKPVQAASTPKPAVAKPAVVTSKPAAKKAAPVVGGFHATHTVAKGETLGGIASQYGVSVNALKIANHIADEKKLSIGQVLSIPQKPR